MSTTLGGDRSAHQFPSTGDQTTRRRSTRIPIFQGGLPAARTRQAQALEGQTLEQVVGTERAVVRRHARAFADL